MSAPKRDRHAATRCTQAVQGALRDDGAAAVVSTTLVSKPAYWAMTTVKPTDDGMGGAYIVSILADSHRVPAREVKIEGSLITNTVKVWWKR